MVTQACWVQIPATKHTGGGGSAQIYSFSFARLSIHLNVHLLAHSFKHSFVHWNREQGESTLLRCVFKSCRLTTIHNLAWVHNKTPQQSTLTVLWGYAEWKAEMYLTQFFTYNIGQLQHYLYCLIPHRQYDVFADYFIWNSSLFIVHLSVALFLISCLMSRTHWFVVLWDAHSTLQSIHTDNQFLFHDIYAALFKQKEICRTTHIWLYIYILLISTKYQYKTLKKTQKSLWLSELTWKHSSSFVLSGHGTNTFDFSHFTYIWPFPEQLTRGMCYLCFFKL